jgi:hypothetical protein
MRFDFFMIFYDLRTRKLTIRTILIHKKATVPRTLAVVLNPASGFSTTTLAVVLNPASGFRQQQPLQWF